MVNKNIFWNGGQAIRRGVCCKKKHIMHAKCSRKREKHLPNCLLLFPPSLPIFFFFLRVGARGGVDKTVSDKSEPSTSQNENNF